MLWIVLIIAGLAAIIVGSVKLYRNIVYKDDATVSLVSDILTCYVDNPSSISIKEISKPAKVYEALPLSEESYNEIVQRLADLDSYVAELVERLSRYDLDYALYVQYQLIGRTEKARNFISSLHQSSKNGAFCGWCVKVLFSAEDQQGDRYSSEYWFFIDKNKRFVYDSFEIPIADKSLLDEVKIPN